MDELKKINACAKRPIDIFTNHLYYPLSIRFVFLIRNTRISPNGLTLCSLFVSLIGCVWFAIGMRHDVVIGLVLVQLAYVLDCADGQLARYRQQFSSIGRWLDQISDRVKEFAIYFSLAYGYMRMHPGRTSVWEWAVVTVFTLYLLEYLAQVPIAVRQHSEFANVEVDASRHHENISAEQFLKLRKVRNMIPFRGFIIGEQYFAILAFLGLGYTLQLLMFVSSLGLLMCIYRPAVQLYKYRKRIA